MPVDTPHPQYAESSKAWKKARDVLGGEETVKSAKTGYLPELEGMEKEDYTNFLTRAPFYEASGRTRQVYQGLIFRKDPILETPDAMMPFLENATGNGQTFQTLLHRSMGEMLDVTRFGVLVDHPPLMPEQRRYSLEQMEASGLRPKLATYCAEDVINWASADVANETVLTMVVLREQRRVTSAKDPFVWEWQTEYRVCDLDEDGFYRQRVFYKLQAGDRARTDESRFVEDPDRTKRVIRRGAPMRRIPFYIFTLSDDDPWRPTRPYLMPLINANLSHYLSGADLEWGAHLTALPTPVITGVELPRNHETGEQEPMNYKIGGTGLWHFESKDADAKMLEFSGAGLGALENRQSAKEHHMAVLGARSLEQIKRSAETAETVQMKYQGDNASLAGLVSRVEATWVQVLEQVRDWMGISGDISVELNKDYIPANMDPALLAQLLTAVQAGRISNATLWRALQRGELASSERTWEDEQQEIEDEGGGLDDMPTPTPPTVPMDDQEMAA